MANSGYPTIDLLSVQNRKLKISSVIIFFKYKKPVFYRFKLRPPHNISGGTHFLGGTNPYCPTIQAVKICPD